MLSKILKPFLYTFYMLAQNPFPTVTLTSKYNFKTLLSVIPVLVLICVSLYVTSYSLKNDQYVTRKNPAREIIHVLLIISSSITNLITAYQCIFLRKAWTELQEYFSTLETEFHVLLPKVDVKYSKFRKHYLMKCFVMLSLYSISIFAMIMSRFTDQKFVTSYMMVLTFINDLNAFQVIFYVDLSKFFLKTITEAFHAVDNGDWVKSSDEKLYESKFIKSTKKLHLNVWKTVEKVNEYFGLFLLGYIVQQFLLISYDIYWIFVNKFNVNIWLSLDNGLVLICDLFSFLLLSDCCDNIYVESQKIVTFLYEKDEYLALSESHHFLSQIMNQPINITAKGFYKLNQSFFAALTVGSMTSAIILVQFQTDN